MGTATPLALKPGPWFASFLEIAEELGMCYTKQHRERLASGVRALIAVTGSLPVLAAEKFCYGLYRGIALGHPLSAAFIDAKALAAVELTSTWDSTLFVLDGDSQFRVGS